MSAVIDAAEQADRLIEVAERDAAGEGCGKRLVSGGEHRDGVVAGIGAGG
jgi:hypothetical protein